MDRINIGGWLALGAIVGLLGCGDDGDSGGSDQGGAGTGGNGDGGGDASGWIAGGAFAPLAGYESSAATGYALLVRTAQGTEVSLQLNGLSAATAYPAHVHALPCAFSGGGHYKIDPAVEDTVADNEVWPMFTSDAEGGAVVALQHAHAVRADAMSVVVHDPAADNAKMLCADLQTSDALPAAASGTFAAFAAAEAVDSSISGTANLTRNADGSVLTVMLDGLTQPEGYAAHLHALPCDVMAAGGHYKIDPTVEDTLADNELWPQMAPDASGSVSSMLPTQHRVRADGQSVVVHRKSVDPAPKVACADLVPAGHSAFATQGTLAAFAAAQERGLSALQASGTMMRRMDGSTHVEIAVSGATASTEYPIHVHDRPCGVASGGGHYKLDASVTDAVESNEIWLTLTTDAQGAGSQAQHVAHTARAEAQSIVVHDGADGERLGCLDLR